MSHYKKFSRTAILIVIGILATTSITTTHFVSEHARLKLCWWYDQALPTLRTIQMCGELLKEYPPLQELTGPEDFSNHVQEALEKHKKEYETTIPFLEDGEAIDKITKDAWGRNLHFSPQSSRKLDYEIFSAGEDGQFHSDDDIGNWDNTHSTHEIYRTARRDSMLLFLFSATILAIFGFTLLKQFSPEKCGVTTFCASALVLMLRLFPVAIYDPAYRVPISPIVTFIDVGIFAGIVLGGLLLTRSGKRIVRPFGFLLAFAPFALWFWTFSLEVLR